MRQPAFWADTHTPNAALLVIKQPLMSTLTEEASELDSRPSVKADMHTPNAALLVIK